MTVLQSGSWVTDTVRLDQRIARGGMAEVWRGEHVTLGMSVAVKCLLPSLVKRTGAMRRFLGEARIAARLNDPHTVRVLDCVVHYGAAGGEEAAFIVMELLEGEDLARHLSERGRLSLDETATVVGQVACALASAHQRGIVHRDVKPENIFLAASSSRRPSVKLLDFGVAKELDRTPGLTMIGVTLGTPQYMSPEQLRGVPQVDERYDVWSLAVVAYLCLTGHLPFEGKTVATVSTAIHDGRPPSASRERADLPTSIDTVFARAFHPRLQSRFQHAQELAGALAEIGRDARPAMDQARPVLPVAISRVRIIDDDCEPCGSLPIDLVRRAPPGVAG